MAEKHLIDTRKVTIPKGFFKDLNVPKLLDWLNNQPAANVIEVVGDINLLKGKIPTAIWFGTDKSPIEYVPVVRCKDCEFRYTKECPQFILPLDDNGFCSYGERKE